MNWSAIAAILMALSVILGAFGAHGLKDRLSPYALDVYEKAVLYHFLHTFGIFLAAILAKIELLSSAGASRVSFLFFLGILLFSGSLYLLAISGVRVLGAITPLGGLAFIAGWLWLAVELFRQKT